MSYWSDLYAGDAAVIAQAFDDARAADGPQIAAHAELPGVLPDPSGALPNTPDLLTELAGSIAKAGSLTFANSIAEHLGGELDPAVATSGAYRMSGDWIALFAGLSDEQVRIVARRWAKECDPDAADIVQPLTTFVESIRDVCRVARERNVPVVYTWTL